jgi:RNA-dependent RNA polymerase
VYRTLLNGIRIGDRHYQFLAFGNSQFRENGAYFFCPAKDLTCADIRHWMGDFTSIKIVAKYAARLGLCFSTTRAIRSNKTAINTIEDVERNGHCFTDGVGKISDSLSVMVANELSLPPSNPVPSAFQFRLGGAKGMLVNWPGMNGEEVRIRKSQWKFKARYNGLEVIRCSRFSPATLNRQTITILSSLGVEDETFNKMLEEQLLNYQTAMTDKHLALDLLARYIDDNHMTMTIAGMVLDGFMEVCASALIQNTLLLTYVNRSKSHFSYLFFICGELGQ